jgi:hypothetical protein
MYKKLMFLISFVALLVCISGASAYEIPDRMWDGEGATDSVCDPLNWEGDTVPVNGQEPAMRYREDGENYAVMDCDWFINEETIKMPAWAGPPGEANLTTLDIVAGANVTCERWGPGWGEGDDGDMHGIVNMSGGLITAVKDDDEAFRICDNRDATLTFNMSGGTLAAPYEGTVRMGDEGGYITINQTGGLWDIDGQFEIKENELTWDISGGTINCNKNFRLKAQNRDQTLNVSGTAELNLNDEFRIGEEVDGGKTCTVNVSGGVINADSINTHDDGGGGHAELNVSGGLVVCDGELKINDDGTSAVNISGGLVQTCDIALEAGVITISGGTLEVTCASTIDCDGGAINITTGTLVLPGNQCGSLPTCVTAYYTEAGACKGSTGQLVCSYDSMSDKTTVTAVEGDPTKAWSPSPADGEDKQVVGVVLQWCAGECIGKKGHAVFLGDTYEAVDTAVMPGSPEFRALRPPASPQTFDPATDATNPPGPIVLDLWTTYFWRIDELNAGGICGTVPDTKGDVWSFTTGCELIDGDLNLDCLVNFEDYAMIADDWRVEVFFPDDVTP